MQWLLIITPDYRVEGQDIKVYPGDKVVIKNHPSILKLLSFICHLIQPKRRTEKRQTTTNGIAHGSDGP